MGLKNGSVAVDRRSYYSSCCCRRCCNCCGDCDGGELRFVFALVFEMLTLSTHENLSNRPQHCTGSKYPTCGRNLLFRYVYTLSDLALHSQLICCSHSLACLAFFSHQSWFRVRQLLPLSLLSVYVPATRAALTAFDLVCGSVPGR